ncbi:hypothetical protein JYG23_13840 [Sedimentibacter sp. zth1]|uniref:hypothetical protein n=1 Tax=Sedimentibacter sp. zth1 TaxID=2816908 RepID=UPI001A92262B|nr:hypothetical protein [Sedimentibacter sp. zth1]QSX05728.1 hypothetical protein JYG23_13840 [Sedimentibacter sp. zth1]
MNEIFKRTLVVLMVLAMSVMTACGTSNASKAEFETGNFDGMVFTNEWANMKFTFPEGSVIATQEEIDAVMKQGNASIYGNDEKAQETVKKAVDLKIVYDFMVANPSQFPSYQLMYENLALTIGGSKYTEKQYLEESMKPVLANENLGYKIVDEGTKKLAGKDFYYYDLSAYNGAAFQTMYCHKLDDRMIIFTVTYAPGQEQTVQQVIDSITEAK